MYYGDLSTWTDLTRDEYVDHLRFTIGGFLSPGNVEAFEYCLRNMPTTGAIVEIGSFLGLSTNIIAYAAHKYRCPNAFFTCDPWVFAGSEKPKAGYFSTATREYRDWVTRLYKMNLALFSSPFPPFTVEAFSDRFFELWNANAEVTDVLGRRVRLGGTISFAYVDGNHTYEVARQDFLNVDDYLIPGGFVFFDDSSDDAIYEGLQQLVAEVASKSNYKLILKTPNYCFQKT